MTQLTKVPTDPGWTDTATSVRLLLGYTQWRYLGMTGLFGFFRISNFSLMDSSPSDATVIQEKQTKKQVRESRLDFSFF
jgi:hypothetical protein